MTTFDIQGSFQGKTHVLNGWTTDNSTGQEIHQQTRRALGFSTEETTTLKILYKGKQLSPQGDEPIFVKAPNKTPKLLVMATSKATLQDLATKRSDPTIRGFQEISTQTSNTKQLYQHWGPQFSHQDKNCKFCRFQVCSWQSFGHRPDDTQTPHAFAAQHLLERLATDPGVVAVLKERELVVGTLGEMDPIDDRLMQKQQQSQPGSCLLGYNTNAGMRIDIKLRTEDLKGFRPYPQLVSTLLHELSHNWVGEHNLLFWANYGQMMAEYLTTHKALQSNVIQGQTTASLAEIPKAWLEDIPQTILTELVRDMAPHGLHPSAIQAPIRQRCQEMQEQLLSGHTLAPVSSSSKTNLSARERALQAAEARRRQSQPKDSTKDQQQHEQDDAS